MRQSDYFFLKQILIIFLFSVLKLNAQEWKVVNFSPKDTSTIEILNERYTFGNGKIKQIGSYRHIAFVYEQIKEDYLPIGRHILYRRNGNIKLVQNYTNTGRMVSDTTYRRNGRVKQHRVFLPEYNIVESDGKSLYFIDRFYIITLQKWKHRL